MEKEMIFHVLGIEETRDSETIQTVYRTLLKDTNPEDNPEGFKRLREAYEAAMEYSRQAESEDTEGEEPEKTEVDLWIEKVAACYEDMTCRCREDIWEKIFRDPVCEGLDTSIEAREKLLVFLMDHVQLPWGVWKMIDKSFSILSDMEQLQEQFPRNFLDYVKYYTENEGFIRFELFTVLNPEKANGDGYLDHYYGVKRKVDQRETEGGLKELDDLAAFGLYYPYEDVERIRIWIAEGNIEEAVSMAESLRERYADDCYIDSYTGKAYYAGDRKEEAYELWQKVLKVKPDYYQAKIGVVQCLMDRKDFYHAKERLTEILDLSYDEEALTLLRQVNEELIRDYKDKLNNGIEDANLPSGEMAVEIGWCLYQNEQIEEAISYVESFEPVPEQEYSYTNLYGRLLHQNGQHEKARPYLEKWLKLIEETVDDGTEENKRRISRKGRAAHTLSRCYQELGEKELAEQYAYIAIESAENRNEKLAGKQLLANVYLKSEQYEKSIDICDQIVKEDTGYLPAYLIRQEAYYELRNGQEVVHDYHRIVEILPGYYKPYLLAAEVFFDHSQFEDAKGVLDRAKENQVEFTAQMKLYEAKILRNLAKSDEDRKVIFKILKEAAAFPEEESDLEDFSEIEFETALLHWDNDFYPVALAHMKKAISQNPDRLQYRLVCGHIYLNDKKYDEALKEYDAAEAVYSETPTLHYNRGLCYEGKGLSAVAAEHFEKTLEYAKTYRDVCEKLADYYEEKYNNQYVRENFDKAIYYIDIQLQEEEIYYYRIYRGNINLRAMEIEAAMADYEKALGYKNDDWTAYNGLACCFKYQGEFERAVEYFQKAIDCMKDSKSVVPYSNMADCYEALHQYEKAVECYKKALEIYPDYTSFWKELGGLYGKLGEFDKAIDAYSHTKESSEYYKNMGNFWYRRGKPYKGMRWYLKGIHQSSIEEKAKRHFDFASYMEDIIPFLSEMHYKIAIANERDHSNLCDYHGDLAIHYYRNKKFLKAKVHAEKAMEYFKLAGEGTEQDYIAYKPFSPVRLRIFGWLYICLGENEKGEEYLEQMDQRIRCRRCRHQKCFEKFYFQGMYYEALDMKEKALQNYEKAKEYNSDDVDITKALEKMRKKVKG
jgi:tetratricopeptide (TPR) repeat protein